jgi:hypothetical protein
MKTDKDKDAGSPRPVPEVDANALTEWARSNALLGVVRFLGMHIFAEDDDSAKGMVELEQLYEFVAENDEKASADEVATARDARDVEKAAVFDVYRDNLLPPHKFPAGHVLKKCRAIG